MYKLTVFIPNSHLDAVKTALFAEGAGKIGDYDQCCWQVQGEGQFRPSQNSTPFIGELYQLTKVPEWRVEMVVAEKCIQEVIKALHRTHPYETPAYDVVKMLAF